MAAKLGGRYNVVPALLCHAQAIADNMRADDRAEIYATSLMTPMQALVASMERTPEPLTGTVDNRPVCMFGVGPAVVLGNIGVPWLLATDELPQHWRTFLPLSQRYIANVIKDYSVLTNFVDARNSVSIRWLKWLGFDIMESVPFGPLGLPFHKFELRQKEG